MPDQNRAADCAEFTAVVAPVICELRRYARSLTRNRADAEDLLQETLLRAYNKFHLWQPGTNIAGWLCVVMKRVFLSQFERRGRMVAVPAEDFDGPQPPSQDDVLDLVRLGSAIGRLQRHHRELIEAVAINGDSYEEAAQAFQIPIGTVRSRLGRARETLRHEIAGDGAKAPQGQKNTGRPVSGAIALAAAWISRRPCRSVPARSPVTITSTAPVPSSRSWSQCIQAFWTASTPSGKAIASKASRCRGIALTRSSPSIVTGGPDGLATCQFCIGSFLSAGTCPSRVHSISRPPVTGRMTPVM
jgi:RNA polymerase sigma-70 factor (ECF subfamily)